MEAPKQHLRHVVVPLTGRIRQRLVAEGDGTQVIGELTRAARRFSAGLPGWALSEAWAASANDTKNMSAVGPVSRRILPLSHNRRRLAVSP